MRSLLLAYVLSAGCSTAKPADPGPTCAQVVDNLVLIFGASLPGHDGMQLIDRGQEIARCEQRAMSRDERVCLHQAKDKTDLARCGRFRRRDREVAPLRAAPSPGHGSASAGSANDGHGSASAGSANGGRGSAGPASGR